MAIREEDIQALKNQSTNLAAISPRAGANLIVMYGRKTLDEDVWGITPEFFEIRKLPFLTGGRIFTPRDMEEKRRVAFMGYHVAKELTGMENPVGEDFLLRGSPYTIVGVLDKGDQADDSEGWDSDSIYVPFGSYRDLTGRETFQMFFFTPQDPLRNKETVESVRDILARRLKFDPTDKGALDFDDFTEFARSADAFMGAVSLLLGAAGVLTLVAGGVGVSNIMRVSVDERMHEIGIRMALGAKSGFVLMSFLLETILLTAIGGVVGLVAAYGTIAVFPRLHLKQYVGTPSLAPTLYLAIVIVLGLIGLASGYGPARRASRMDPVVAMKQ